MFNIQSKVVRKGEVTTKMNKEWKILNLKLELKETNKY